METILIILILIGVGTLLVKYLDGDFTYIEEVVEINTTYYIIKRTYLNGKIVLKRIVF